MRYWPERLHVSENPLDIFFIHSTIDVPRHDLIQLSRLVVSGAHHLRESGLVKIGDSGRIRRDVGAGYFPPRTIQDEAAGKFHACKRLPVGILRRMAMGAS